ncbi:MAG: GNAT family N-acetyltransferase, partial [Erysipelotrichaceae bacterium]|nr:GNAT family N-acetyltransferase [Erysipelotrichaceae bacterium]
DASDSSFCSEISGHLDFWDTLTCDTREWETVVSSIHPNPFVRKYIRRRYSLAEGHLTESTVKLPEGYVLEKVTPETIRNCPYGNADEVTEWMENFDDESFVKYGSGVYLRKEDTIVSWSLSDCAAQDRIAIGIQTDERFRHNGFGKIVAGENVRQCFAKGYRSIDWLCTDFNKGSIRIAEGLGFILQNTYISYTPYVPIENITDLDEKQWLEWAEYFEQASKEDERYFEESIYTYVKANHPGKVLELLRQSEQKDELIGEIKQYIGYLKGFGMASRFSDEWDI